MLIDFQPYSGDNVFGAIKYHFQNYSDNHIDGFVNQPSDNYEHFISHVNNPSTQKHVLALEKTLELCISLIEQKTFDSNKNSAYILDEEHKTHLYKLMDGNIDFTKMSIYLKTLIEIHASIIRLNIVNEQENQNTYHENQIEWYEEVDKTIEGIKSEYL